VRLGRRIGLLDRILEERRLETAPRRSREEDRRTAVHEAGHAVARFELGGDAIGPISIVPDGFSQGRVHVRGRERGLRRPPIARELAFLLAGSVAEALEWPDLFGGEALISPTDHAQAMKLLEGLKGFEKRLWKHEGYSLAKRTLSRPEVWAQVQALAARLLKDRKLTALQATRFCKRVRREFLAR
jgi:hypothetical protein